MAKDDPIIRSAPRRPEESTDLEKRRCLLACPTDILGIVGFGLYLAWFYLVMSCSITSGAGISHAAGSLLVAAFLLGESLAAIVIAPSAKRLAKRKAIKAIAVAAAILLAAPEITVLLTDAETLLFATWFLSGFGAVLLLSLWGVFLSKLAHLQTCCYTSISALIAVSVLGFTRICLKPYMISVGGLLVVLASLGLFAGWAFSARSTGGIVLFENTRPPDWGALLHSAGAMVANSFLLGFGFYALSISTSFGAVAVIGGMLAGSLFKVVDVCTGIRYQVDKIIKVIAPVAATCLLLLPFVSVEFRFALLFLMAAFATIHEVICWAAVAEYMHIHESSPLRTWPSAGSATSSGCFSALSRLLRYSVQRSKGTCSPASSSASLCCCSSMFSLSFSGTTTRLSSSIRKWTRIWIRVRNRKEEKTIRLPGWTVASGLHPAMI